MKKTLIIAALVAVIPFDWSLKAAELPAFEAAGFPISAHQTMALIGSARVVERAAAPSLTVSGMPASPHQIAVLTSRATKRASTVEAANAEL
jgi:hypothetical protein